MAERTWGGRLDDILKRLRKVERRLGKRASTSRKLEMLTRFDSGGWRNLNTSPNFTVNTNEPQYIIHMGILSFRGDIKRYSGNISGGYHQITPNRSVLAPFHSGQGTETVLVSSGSGGIGRGYLDSDGALQVYANTANMTYVALHSWAPIVHPNLYD